jgi:hypothetical protein
VIDEVEVRAALQKHSLVEAISRLPRGHLRLETGFRYPDGTSIEVYLVEEGPGLPPRRVSDLGQTMAWLLNLQVKPWLSKKRQLLIEDALRTYGVRQSGGALDIELGAMDDLMRCIVSLGQACLRVADLIYTRRASLQASYSEEMEELFIDAELSYESNVELPGRFQAPVRVDYLVSGARSRSLVLGWSSGSASQAHVVANELFRMWYDLDVPDRSEQRVTLFDDRYDVYRTDDLNRLRASSTVLALSDRQAVRDLLAA